MSNHFLRRGGRRFGLHESASPQIVPAKTDVLTGLLSAWPGNGSTVDVYGTNAGTAQGALSYGAGLNGYQAFLGNGTSAWISTATSFNNPQLYTWTLWFKVGTTSSPLLYFDSSQTGQGGSHDRQLGMDSTGRVYWGVYSSGAVVVYSTNTYADNNWHFVVLNVNSVGNLYVDGILRATNTATAVAYSGWWHLGHMNPTGGWPASNTYFSGLMQDIRLYSANLSLSQIQTMYNNGPLIP